MAVKITIPVEFTDSAQSYRQLIDQLQKQLNTLKPGTGLYNSIKEQINKAKEEIIPPQNALGIANRTLKSINIKINKLDLDDWEVLDYSIKQI